MVAARAVLLPAPGMLRGRPPTEASKLFDLAPRGRTCPGADGERAISRGAGPTMGDHNLTPVNSQLCG
jgi:hypothetical protein